MKKHILSVILISLTLSSYAAEKAPAMKFTEASELQLVGKLFPDTPNPYHRVDTCKYKGFTETENKQVRESSGIAVAFKTNSPKISVVSQYGVITYTDNTNGFSARGYDLYIRKDGKWQWAGSKCPKMNRENGYECVLIDNMDNSMKECLLYLPLYSEEYSVKVGVTADSEIEKIANPFKGRIAVFGSSYTHGSSTSRPGMPWPAQFSRHTGFQMLSLGCSGNSKLQDYFARALADADVDAYVFDAFSNPNAKMIDERLFKFIEIIRAKKSSVPMIFLKSADREFRRFNQKVENNEAAKMHMADSLMKIACEKYPHVYWVDATCTKSELYEPTVDGTHPDNFGYYLWAKSVEEPVCEILAHYGLKKDYPQAECLLPIGVKYGEHHPLQAFAISKDVLFQCYDAGRCRTYDFKTGEMIAEFDMDCQIATNHCGNANFGKQYPKGNHRFPALYVSGDLTNRCCYVMSVDEKSTKRIQTIWFDLDNGYGGSQAIIDNERNRIVYMQRELKAIRAKENNFIIYEFRLPKLSEGNVTFTEKDIIESYRLDTYLPIYQGAHILKGKIYQSYGNGRKSAGYAVYDLKSHKMEKNVIVREVIPYEPQMVQPYKGRIIMNFGQTGKVYEIK